MKIICEKTIVERIQEEVAKVKKLNKKPVAIQLTKQEAVELYDNIKTAKKAQFTAGYITYKLINDCVREEYKISQIHGAEFEGLKVVVEGMED